VSGPRLSEHVIARRMVSGEDERVVLLDVRSSLVLPLDDEEWELLRWADGTRDLDEIVRAAAATGLDVGHDEARALFERLRGYGVMARGPWGPPPPAALTPPDRPLDVLPGARFRCTADGPCCVVHRTIGLLDDDVERAAGLVPDVDVRRFTPLRGTARSGEMAVTVVSGRCVYLDGHGLCRIHAAGGEAAKPAGCRSFPRRYVDDGLRVRVSMLTECACVLESMATGVGEPLVPPAARVAADLEDRAAIACLPPVLRVTRDGAAPLAEIRAHNEALLARSPADVPAALFALAAAVEAVGPRRETARVLDATRLEVERVRHWLRALARHLAGFVEVAARYRDGDDVALRVAGWARAAADALAAADDPVPPAVRPDLERAAFELDLHGYRHVTELPLVLGLRERAVRLLIARALPAFMDVATRTDRRLREPISLVDAVFRAHDLHLYVNRLQ
jgi:lysine-N-methylase